MNVENLSTNGNGENNWQIKWERAFADCFHKVDVEVGGGIFRRDSKGEVVVAEDSADRIAPETVGSTAVVAVVGACQIIVSNCGDSRAVLSRGGRAFALSVDHKVMLCFAMYLLWWSSCCINSDSVTYTPD